ncbi:MAG TPA: ATP-binding protein [Bryobacteraceae bacterium]|jgi:two-component system sensor histidine kinase KdpD|nr:ATP-binding protein [Bryobacteraceae bacterium]
MRGILTRLGDVPVAMAGIVTLTFLFYRVMMVNDTTAALGFLLAILFTAAYGKLAAAIAASVLATLCLDYYFLPPIGTITIAAAEDWAALAVFLAVALLTSHVSTRFRRQRDELRANAREIEQQYALSRALLMAGPGEDFPRLVVNKCMEVFGFTEAVLFEAGSGQAFRSEAEGTITDDKLRHVALYGSVASDPERKLTVIPVTLGNRTLGSLGFRGSMTSEASRQALGNIVAIGLAQAQAQEAGCRAAAVRKGEELKSVLLDALAHDLKTPLTAMEASVDLLLQPTLISSEQRRELLQIVQQEVRGLKRMVAQAIHLARIDAERLKLNLQPKRPGELVEAALQLLGEGSASRRFDIEIAEDLPAVAVDAELLVQALKQIIDNALKYGAPRSPIVIAAEEMDGMVSISVRDHGRGITEVERRHVFDKFYRGPFSESAIQGTGMGLSIAREIVEAHNGSIRVESEPGKGSRFTISLHAMAESERARQEV